MRRLISVAVPVPFLDALTYNVPDALPIFPPVGARVRVPVGSRVVTGVVMAHGAALEERNEPKDVIEAVDADPFLPEPVVRLCEWVADYYVAGIGDAIGVAMPPGARYRPSSSKTFRVVSATAHGKESVRLKPGPTYETLTAKQIAALEVIATAPAGLPMSDLR